MDFVHLRPHAFRDAVVLNAVRRLQNELVGADRRICRSHELCRVLQLARRGKYARQSQETHARRVTTSKLVSQDNTFHKQGAGLRQVAQAEPHKTQVFERDVQSRFLTVRAAGFDRLFIELAGLLVIAV